MKKFLKFMFRTKHDYSMPLMIKAFGNLRSPKFYIEKGH